MPTTAKLVAAAWFAAIGWLAANAHVPALGPEAQVGLFREICAGIGFLCGWLVMGRLVGGGLIEALGNGLRTSVTLAFFALLLFAIIEMVGESMKMRYDGPMGAVLGVFQLMLEQAQLMLTVGVLGVLVLGGCLGGVITEGAHRKWR